MWWRSRPAEQNERVGPQVGFQWTPDRRRHNWFQGPSTPFCSCYWQSLFSVSPPSSSAGRQTHSHSQRRGRDMYHLCGATSTTMSLPSRSRRLSSESPPTYFLASSSCAPQLDMECWGLYIVPVFNMDEIRYDGFVRRRVRLARWFIPQRVVSISFSFSLSGERSPDWLPLSHDMSRGTLTSPIAEGV